MKNLKIVVAYVLMVFLVGCAAVQPIKNQISEVSVEPVTYVYNGDGQIRQPEFKNYNNRHVHEYGQKNSGVTSKWSGDNLLITKYVNNGVAGTVNEYSVKVSESDNEIEFVPYKNRVHQDGLVLPFPVPVFSYNDISDFLSVSRHNFTFEVDSDFPSESVNANFKRMLTQKHSNYFAPGSEKIFANTYFLSVAGADAKVDVKTYPYRNGSKCTIKAVYYTKPAEGGKIILGEIEENIRAKVIEVVNS